jgi:hypothetical protein
LLSNFATCALAHLVDTILEVGNLLARETGQFEINSRSIWADLDAGENSAELPARHRVDDVHQAVVAHQRVPERPVYHSSHGFADGKIASDEMPDSARGILTDCGNRDSVTVQDQVAAIMGLTAAARIKDCL